MHQSAMCVAFYSKAQVKGRIKMWLKIQNQIWTALISTFLFLLSTSATLADECDAILKSGVRNTFHELRTTNFDQSFQNAYCQKTSSSRASSSDTQLGGSYAGFGIDLGQSGSDTAAYRQENCGNNAFATSEAKYLNALQSVADPNIVDAWRACKTRAYGLYINGDLNGDDFDLIFKFLPAGSISSTEITGGPWINGAICNPQVVEEGTIIDTGGLIIPCKRRGNEAVSVRVNSRFGPAKFYIPAVLPMPVRPAVIDIPLDSFRTASACVGTRNPQYSVPMLHGCPPPGTKVEYTFEAAATGKYWLNAMYAGGIPQRVVAVYVNGQLISPNGLGDDTGGLEQRHQQWKRIPGGPVELRAGSNSLGLYSNGALPHITAIRLVPQ
jgi:hypothetical protein